MLNTADTECPACHHKGITCFLDLGEMPAHVGMQWPTPQKARSCPRGPIQLAFCPACSFVTNVVFDEGRLDYPGCNYDNSLGFSTVYQKYERDLVDRLIRTYGIRNSLVTEIGSGDGSFLKHVCAAGDNQGVGFDPSLDEKRCQPDSGTRFVRGCYSPAELPAAPALVVCRQVFEHLPQPLDFLRELHASLAGQTDTILFFETPSFDHVLRNLDIWTIIYEHPSYFGCQAMPKCFAKAGFHVRRVYESYGDTYVSIEASPARPGHLIKPSIHQSRTVAERIPSFLARFEQKLTHWRQRTELLVRRKQRAVAWGGGARAVTFFNLLGIEDPIPYVVDLNPNKTGKYLPGTAQRIVLPEFLREYRPDVVIIMNDIYRREIQECVEALGLNVEYLPA